MEKIEKDTLHTTTKWIDHNRGQFIGVLLAIIVMAIATAFTLAGCSTTASLLVPGQKVDRAAFIAEAADLETELIVEGINLQANVEKHNARIAGFNSSLADGIADLDAQDAQIEGIVKVGIEAGLAYGSGGSSAALPIVLGAFGLLGSGYGIGTASDRKRKDAKINTQKVKIAALEVKSDVGDL